MNLALIIVVCSMASLVCSIVQVAEGNTFTIQQLQEASAVGLQRLKLGEEAIMVLKDQNATAQAKSNAALAIGELNDIRSISVLIEQINLENPVGRTGESDIGSKYPCVRALADLGISAVPALVDSYAHETRKDRRELIRLAIIFGKAYSEAKTYTQGRLSQTKDPDQRTALEELLKLIPKEEKVETKE